MTEEVFEESLSTLRSGYIPINMAFVAAYIDGTTKEFVRYTDALTECAFRQANKLKVVQGLNKSMDASLRRKAEPRDCSGLILWTNARANELLEQAAREGKPSKQKEIQERIEKFLAAAEVVREYLETESPALGNTEAPKLLETEEEQ